MPHMLSVSAVSRKHTFHEASCDYLACRPDRISFLPPVPCRQLIVYRHRMSAAIFSITGFIIINALQQSRDTS